MTNVVRKSSEKTETLFQAHIGNLYLGRNNAACCYNLKAIGWKWFFYIMAMGIAPVWVAYSIILFGYIFLVEGGRNRRRLMMRKEENPFPYEAKGMNGQDKEQVGFPSSM